MGFGSKAPTTAASMMAANPVPAVARTADAADTAAAAAEENRARAKGIQSTYLRNFFSGTSTPGSTKQTLGT